MRNVHSYQGGAVDGRPVLGTTGVYVQHDSVSAWKCSYVSGQCKRMCERTTEHKGQWEGWRVLWVACHEQEVRE